MEVKTELILLGFVRGESLTACQAQMQTLLGTSDWSRSSIRTKQLRRRLLKELSKMFVQSCPYTIGLFPRSRESWIITGTCGIENTRTQYANRSSFLLLSAIKFQRKKLSLLCVLPQNPKNEINPFTESDLEDPRLAPSERIYDLPDDDSGFESDGEPLQRYDNTPVRSRAASPQRSLGKRRTTLTRRQAAVYLDQ